MKRRQQRDAGRCELQRISVLEFFSDEARWSAVRSYISPGPEEESRVSLRLIDYFVTNYARKFLCDASGAPSGAPSGGAANVYQSVQSALRGLNKKRMDPFCRRHAEKDQVEIKGVHTNVAQLSFFRWALINGVLRYIEQHAEEIRADMKATHWESSFYARTRASSPINNVVIQLPEDYVEENPGELERLRITLQEKMQRPRRKRKRLNDGSAVEVVSRVAAGSGGAVFQTGAMRL